MNRQTDRQTDTHTDTQYTYRGHNHENEVLKKHNPDVNQSAVTIFECMKPLLYP